MAMAAQQRQWRRSHGDSSGAAMATAAQRWQQRRSDSLCSAATTMTMAVQQWGWQWWWQWWWRLSNGGVANDECGAAMVVDRGHYLNCIACALFLSNKLISYIAFYIGPIQTGFLRGLNKKLRRNRNCDSCEKRATGTENTGIRRIPAGIGNLGHKVAAIHSYTLTRYLSQMLGFFWVTCGIKMIFDSRRVMLKQ